MKLVWGRRARHDFNELISYIPEQSVRTAELVASRIDKAAALLMQLPHAGRGGRVEGTRELVVQRTPYILVYRIQVGHRADSAHLSLRAPLARAL